MRKLYILRLEEEDGRVADAIAEAGLHPDDIANPVCPLCGSPTLVAYEEEGEYDVLTWYCLTQDSEPERPEAWYLICLEFTCPYEEQVERVMAPRGADLFDLHISHSQLDEYCGLIDRHPADQKRLIRYLERLRKAYPFRKLDAYLQEARWRYNYELKQVRRWLNRIPAGRRIWFCLDGEKVEAEFIAATDEGMLVRTEPDGGVLAVTAEAIDMYGPRRFGPEEDPPKPDLRNIDPDSLIHLFTTREHVVVRGYHLRLVDVDRYGFYHVATSDPEAARSLGLKPRSENYWEGHLRRSQVEARYEIHRMVRVKGHWVLVYGETSKSKHPAVMTENPDIAAALGLEPMVPLLPEEEDRPSGRPRIERWEGIIPTHQVEAWDEVRVYHWPIPEARTRGSGEH